MRRYYYWRVLLPNGEPTEGQADAFNEAAMLKYINSLNYSAMLGDGSRGRWHYWMDAGQLTGYQSDPAEHRGSRR